MDYSHLDPVYPDKTSPAGAKYRYSRSAIVARGRDALSELYDRTEKAIIVVSHSGFLRQGVTGSWYFNADYRIYDFLEKTPDGHCQLEQWPETNKGGLGKSWEEKIVIGEGIPEDDLQSIR